MLNFLPPLLVGLIATLLMVLNVLFWVPVLLLFSLLKLLISAQKVRLWVDPILLRIAEAWISGNSAWMRLTQRTTWDVQGLGGLNPQSWYLVSCNHQSWVDILVFPETAADLGAGDGLGLVGAGLPVHAPPQ